MFFRKKSARHHLAILLDSLNDTIAIYQGTNEDKFNSNKFGQAWQKVKYCYIYSFIKNFVQ